MKRRSGPGGEKVDEQDGTVPSSFNEEGQGESTTTSSDRDSASSHVNRPGLSIALIFAVSVAALGLVLYNCPELNEEDSARLRWPCDLESAKDLGRLLSKYKDTHYYTVISAVAITYVFLQTFAIPGSIFLSILSGFLFPFPLALLLVCMCSALGATFCYLLSAMVGHRLVRRYLPERLQKWRQQISRHGDDMLWYIIFLRITPFLPNWFINLASPIVGVRVTPFFWGTFLGVAPPSFLFIRAGTTLYELTTTTGHISLVSISILGLLALLSITPVIYKRYRPL